MVLLNQSGSYTTDTIEPVASLISMRTSLRAHLDIPISSRKRASSVENLAILRTYISRGFRRQCSLMGKSRFRHASESPRRRIAVPTVGTPGDETVTVRYSEERKKGTSERRLVAGLDRHANPKLRTPASAPRHFVGARCSQGDDLRHTLASHGCCSRGRPTGRK